MAIVHYEFEEKNGFLIAVLRGSLDASNATQFGVDMQKNLDAGEVNNIAFDIAALDNMTSAGLRVVMVAIKHCRPKGGKFMLVSPNGNIRQLIRIANLGAFVDIADSRAAAGLD